jgi:hypothetical protein
MICGRGLDGRCVLTIAPSSIRLSYHFCNSNTIQNTPRVLLDFKTAYSSVITPLTTSHFVGLLSLPELDGFLQGTIDIKSVCTVLWLRCYRTY